MSGRYLSQAFTVATALIGAVIGAGFASGQEVVSFFHPLGPAAPVGLASAALALAAGGLLVVRSACAQEVEDYGRLFRATAGPGLGAVMDALVSAFLFLTLAVTIAGGAAVLCGSYRVPSPAALGITGLLGCLLVIRGPARLFRASSLMVPLLVAVLLIILSVPSTSGVIPDGRSPVVLGASDAGPAAPARQAGLEKDPPAGAPCGTADAVASGLLYGAYNLVLGAGILVAGVKYRGRRAALAGAAAGGLALSGLAARILVACRSAGAGVLGAQVPVAALAARSLQGGVHLCALALGLAVLTTVGCIAISLAERCGFRGRARGLGPALLIVAASPLAYWGFARLVRTVYPALGLLGICWLAILVIRPVGQE